MGMDVYGNAPTTESGEHFRNNVWWWRPLWVYCGIVADDLLTGVNGQTNDGDGLDADQAAELASRLHDEINSGATAEYAAAYQLDLSVLPRESCKYCDATGIRTDTIGEDAGMPLRALDSTVAAVVGRTHGWCNACNGEGQIDNWALSYRFSVDNVQKFAHFLSSCGGFKIY